MNSTELPFDPIHLDRLVERALEEDRGSGDVTTRATVPESARISGRLLVKDAGTVAGLLAAERFFRRVDEAIRFEPLVEDGSAIPAGTTAARLRGPARPILTAERPVLNLVQRMSGIATGTRRMVEAVRAHEARILDTRKTVPGLRRFDKWAVRLGGGTNHRMGLYDQILIKENHVTAAGGLSAALRSVAAYLETHELDLPVEIETRTMDEVEAVLETGGADRILLDNMVRRSPDGRLDTSLLRRAVDRIGDRAETEASGNVTVETVGAIAASGVDYISSGALTHSVRALDCTLLFNDAASP